MEIVYYIIDNAKEDGMDRIRKLFKKFFEWIEKGVKKQPPSCGGSCCK